MLWFSIQASTYILKEIAAFLIRCADKFDKEHAGEYEHFHLCDERVDWDEESTDSIVFMSPID